MPRAGAGRGRTLAAMARRTELPDSRVTPRFSGVCTFCRFPLVERVRPENLPLDWAIYGVAYDGGVTYRPGARFGPRAVREQSQYVKPYHLEFGVNVAERLSIADVGDAPVNPYEMEKTLEGVAAWAMGLGDAGHTRLLCVGGDHSVAYANLKATWSRRGKPKGGLALLHFDSHLDTVDRVWGEKWGHASVFIRAIEDGLVDPGAMLSVGVKGPLNTAEDLEFAKKHGVTVVGYTEAVTEAGRKKIAEFVRGLKDREAYVTFDVDVVDPAYAPGTGTPSIGGFTSAEALGLLRMLRGVRVAGADVVEVLPERDVGGITALLAGHVMLEVLALSV